MYTMVLMMAMTTSGDTAAFGKRGGGCGGCSGEVVVVSAGCSGGCIGDCGGGGRKHKLFGGRERGGLFGKHRNSCNGCNGGCNGCNGGCNGCNGGGCTGVVVATPAPVCYTCGTVVAAPVVTSDCPAVGIATPVVTGETPPVAMPDPKPEDEEK